MRDDGHTPIEDPQDIRAADRTRHTPHDGYDPVRWMAVLGRRSAIGPRADVCERLYQSNRRSPSSPARLPNQGKSGQWKGHLESPVGTDQSVVSNCSRSPSYRNRLGVPTSSNLRFPRSHRATRSEIILSCWLGCLLNEHCQITATRQPSASSRETCFRSRLAFRASLGFQ